SEKAREPRARGEEGAEDAGEAPEARPGEEPTPARGRRARRGDGVARTAPVGRLPELLGPRDDPGAERRHEDGDREDPEQRQRVAPAEARDQPRGERRPEPAAKRHAGGRQAHRPPPPAR